MGKRTAFLPFKETSMKRFSLYKCHCSFCGVPSHNHHFHLQFPWNAPLVQNFIIIPHDLTSSILWHQSYSFQTVARVSLFYRATEIHSIWRWCTLPSSWSWFNCFGSLVACRSRQCNKTSSCFSQPQLCYQSRSLQLKSAKLRNYRSFIFCFLLELLDFSHSCN